MGFLNPNVTIHKNKLGHSQGWRFKKQKNITVMTNNYHKFSLSLFFDISNLLLIYKLRLCQF